MKQVMKQYKSDTGKDARVMFIVIGKDESSKEYTFFTDEFVAWIMNQLRWRPVSEKLPSVEKDRDAVIARLKDLDEGLVQFDVVSTLWFIDNYESWYTHWLPIPPATEVKV